MWPDGLKTLAEQLRIRVQFGPEFLGDPGAIKVGLTPRQLVYEESPHQLWCYPGQLAKNQPILLVYSLINRPYIFDLRPGRSLIEFLCQSGFDVYLLDWGLPLPENSRESLADLIGGTMARCVRKILRQHRCESLSILGYCMGGTFAALYAGLHPERVSQLTLLTTPLGPDGLLQNIAHKVDWHALGQGQPLISGRQLKQLFNAIRPAGALKKERDFWKNQHDPTFLDHFLPVEKWSNETPDIPSQAFVEFLQLCFQDNLMTTGKPFLVGNMDIDLSRVTCPVFAVAAEHDWIIPASSLASIKQALPNAKHTSYLIPGGHIGLVVGKQAGQLWQTLRNELQ